VTDCRNWMRELVEQARIGAPAGAELAAHLAACPNCAALWDTERELSARFRQIRQSVSAGDPSAGRKCILAQFQSQRRRTLWQRGFAWTLAPVAVLVLALVLLAPWHHPARRGSAVPANDVLSLSLPGWSGAAEDADSPEIGPEDSAGFLPVPFVPPLASGEAVRVERVELPQAALVCMGFAVEGVSQNAVTAEVVVGEDGLPRAVRLPDSLDMQDRDFYFN